MVAGIVVAGVGVRTGDSQQPSLPRSGVPISAWVVRDSDAFVARHPSAEDFFDSTAALSNPPSGSLEQRALTTGSGRSLVDSLDRIVGIAVRDRGDQAAIAMLHQQRVTMHFRQGYVGGLRFIDLSNGRDVTPAPLRDDPAPAEQPVYTRDQRSLIVARYHELPGRRNCPYVACGEDEFTRFDIWVHRVDLATGTDAKLFRVGRDDMEAAAPGFLISPAGDRVLVWSNAAWTDRTGSRMRPTLPRMTDVATRKLIPGFRRDALAMSEERISVSCASDSTPTGFIEFSPDGRLLARGTERAVKLIDARTGSRVAERMLSASAERYLPTGDSTQTVILNGHVSNDSSLVLTTCRPGVTGSRVESISMRTGERRILYTTSEILRDAVQRSEMVVVRSDTAVWSVKIRSR
jgi:hypothetical protein